MPPNLNRAWKNLRRTVLNKKAHRSLSRRFCDPDWIQTNGLLLRRQLLYSAELPGHNAAAKVIKSRAPSKAHFWVISPVYIYDQNDLAALQGLPVYRYSFLLFDSVGVTCEWQGDYAYW
jgi:hypothetical protein